MKQRKYSFEQIKIASPCKASWGEMTGDEQVRFCGACERPVYNLSSMTGHEIAELIRETEGMRRCVRFYRRPDGTMLTQDCPIGHAKARRKALAVFASGVAAILGGPFLFKKLTQSVDAYPMVMGEMIVPEELNILEPK